MTVESLPNYEIQQELGRGGMGYVRKVWNKTANRPEAMKLILPEFAADPELLERFLREIRTQGRLSHPRIAVLYNATQTERGIAMFMEYLEGDTLANIVKKGRLPMSKILLYVKQTLDALAFAHKNGVIHRDMKPSNIMITSRGVKLMDFGIARSKEDVSITLPGTTLGSMLYMSPEQLRGETIDARSDLYSAGLVLYQLATGKQPFDGSDTSRCFPLDWRVAPFHLWI